MKSLTLKAALLAAVMTPAASADFATIELLPFAGAHRVSFDGSTIIGTDSGLGGAYYYNANDGLVIIADASSAGAGHTVQSLTDVNLDGSIIAGNITDGTNSWAAQWSNDIWTKVETTVDGVVGLSGGTLTSCHGMSPDGSVLTGLMYIDVDPDPLVTDVTGRGFRWDAVNGTVVLSHEGASTGFNGDITRASRGNTVEADNQTIHGWEDETSGNRDAKIWHADGSVSFPLLDAGVNFGLGNFFRGNSDSSIMAGQQYACVLRHSDGSFTMPFGDGATVFDQSWFTGVSDEGNIAVGTQDIGWGTLAPLFWDTTNGTMDTAAFAAAYGLQMPANYAFGLVGGISADGRTIVGWGQDQSTFAASSFIITLPDPATTEHWSNLGGALAGTNGDIAFTACSTMVAGDEVVFAAHNAEPNAVAMLIISTTSSPVPFKGGTLIAYPIGAGIFFGIGNDGEFRVTDSTPALPSGLELFTQLLVQDNGAPVGVAISNAMYGLVP